MTTSPQAASLDDFLDDTAPTVLHALVHTALVASVGGYSLILNPGDSVTVTDELRELNRDRLGRCALDRPELFTPGPAPADLARLAPSRAGTSRTFATYERRDELRDYYDAL